jgi:hypothetical protein
MGFVLGHSQTRAGWQRLVCALGAVAGLLLAGPSLADIGPLSTSSVSPSVQARLPDASSGSLLAPQADAACSLPIGSVTGPTEAAVGTDVSRLPPSVACGLGRPIAFLPDRISGDQQGTASTEKVENLPASPSSLAVALSSLLTLGGWRLVRQARHVQLVCVPEWYHAGGPGQIGHATPLDLGTTLNVLPICWYQPDCVRVDGRPMAYYDQTERCAVWNSLSFIPTSAPRAPPSLF